MFYFLICASISAELLIYPDVQLNTSYGFYLSISWIFASEIKLSLG